jgi:hypothetical protein
LTVAIVSALVTAGVLGLHFSSTRGIAIISIAILSFFFPPLGALILIGSAAAFYILRIRK